MPTRPYLEAAKQVAVWIRASAVATPAGPQWPIQVGEPLAAADLYDGSSGILLFFLELYRTTGDDTLLDGARQLGAQLALGNDTPDSFGLFDGRAGVAFALNQLATVTGEDIWHEATRSMIRELCDGAILEDGCAHWNEFGEYGLGSAGIGFVLLEVGARHDPRALELACAAGRELQRAAVASHGGLKWAVRTGTDSCMPNLSHGTAGNVMYLARLSSATAESSFLETALEGAGYLLAVGRHTHDGFGVFHHEPGGEEIYQLGWCHGSTGLTWAFHQLHLSTSDDAWHLWRERAATAVVHSGIPERRFPGFWDNLGWCCGSAGVADTFLELHQSGGRTEYLNFARSIADHIVARATADDRGMRWSNIEFRSIPPELPPQTGWMQGASGIGATLVRLDRFLAGDDTCIHLPGSPFSRLT